MARRGNAKLSLALRWQGPAKLCAATLSSAKALRSCVAQGAAEQSTEEDGMNKEQDKKAEVKG